MTEHEKEQGFMGKIKKGLGHVSQIISAGIVPGIEDGARAVMKTVDKKIIIVENRILKKIYSLIILVFGGVFLIFALLFFLIDNMAWSKAAAFFSIGITIFVIGLLLKLIDHDKSESSRSDN